MLSERECAIQGNYSQSAIGELFSDREKIKHHMSDDNDSSTSYTALLLNAYSSAEASILSLLSSSEDDSVLESDSSSATDIKISKTATRDQL